MRVVMPSALFIATAALAAVPAVVSADDDRDWKIVTVAFAAGLNTAQPGNSANHHVLPDTIRISASDVISFNVAGLHVIRVYEQGMRLNDVKCRRRSRLRRSRSTASSRCRSRARAATS